MHPSCELRPSGALGLGVYATAPIPRGTIVYVKDALEIEIWPHEYQTFPAPLRPAVDTYSYVDRRGVRVVSWDMAKYVNHRCECNTMSTGWGFEIALRNIRAGEEITDEYGLFNLDAPMILGCGCRNCRGVLRPDDAERHHGTWDRRVRAALRHARTVPQPLWDLLDAETCEDLEAHLDGRSPYRSVLELCRTAVPAWQARKGAPAPSA